MRRTEHQINFKSTYEISGTLTMPNNNKAKHPAIVIVSGSGGLDRDGNQMGFKTNIYKTLSDYLVSLGFATLRYDKRGIGQSEGSGHQTGMWDLIEDIKAAVGFLKGQDMIDPEKVVLLGHSEGCILLTEVYQDLDLAGLILMSGAGVSMATSMREQLNFLLDEVKSLKGFKGFLLRRLIKDEKIRRKQEGLFQKVRETEADSIKVQLRKFPAKWLREHLAIEDQDMLNLLTQCRIPVLAVTGTKDVQTDYRNLKAVEALNNPEIQVQVIDNMNHLLKRFDGDMSVLDVKKHYNKIKKDGLHKSLEDLLKQWLSQYLQD